MFGKFAMGAAIVVALALVGSGIAPPANATMLSYNQAWYENGVPTPGLFDDIQVFVFEPQATDVTLTSLSNGWTGIGHGAQWFEASGNNASLEDFTLNFTYDSAMLPIAVDFFAFESGAIVDSASISYLGGSGYNVSILDPMSDPSSRYRSDMASAVPEPSSFAIFATCLLSLGMLALRRRQPPATFAAS